MTERPEGTPEAAPEETEDLPAAETSVAGADEPAAEPAGFDVDAESAAGTDDADDADDADDEPGTDQSSSPGPQVAAIGGVVPLRRAAPPPSLQRAPTQSELAVRVTDNVSRYFVIATVVFFVGILLFGMLGGAGGLVTATPAPVTPAPVTSAPSAAAS